MTSLVDNGNIIIRTIVPQVSAITSRKGNPISRRTLRFLLVCKVIGSPSRSRFARESSIFYRSGRGTLLPGRDTILQLQDARAPLFGMPPSATFLSSIYVSIPLSSRFPIADLSPRPLHRLGSNKETAVHICYEILLPMAETPRNVRQDKSRLYRRSLITLALRREISLR